MEYPLNCKLIKIFILVSDTTYNFVDKHGTGCHSSKI